MKIGYRERGKGVFWKSLTIFLAMCLSLAKMASAGTDTVQEEEPRYKTVTTPSKKLFIKKVASRDNLLTDMVVGVTQGYDTNVNLDTTKKGDSYTQEDLDTHFRYPLIDFTDTTFGFNITNINYYKITDPSILNAVADAAVEQKLFEIFTLKLGYEFETMWYPHDEDGTYLGNAIVIDLKHDIIPKKLYHRGRYKLLFKNFTDRKARLGNGNKGSPLRHDLRNIFEYEVGMYLTKMTKLKVLNQYYINDSNDQYYDYYDYNSDKVGASLTQLVTKKLYGIAGFWAQFRRYEGRTVTDKDKRQRDTLYIFSGSILYDFTKNTSLFANYSHRENHTNEPLDKYSDNIYSCGVYYSF
jgi:hypothetical protein